MWVSISHSVLALTPLSVDVLYPWALLGGLLVVPTVWLAYATRTSAPRWRQVVGTTLRIVAVAALTLAVAQARLVRTSDKICLTVLVDQSKSIDAESRQQTLRSLDMALQAMEGNQRVAVIGFGGRSILQQLPGSDATLTPMQGEFASDFTDIGQAIRLALSVAPQDAANRILLLTDGNDTVAESTALAAAGVARQTAVPIDVYALGSASADDVRVERLVLDPQAQEGQPFAIKAVVHSDVAQDVEMTLTCRDAFVDLSEQTDRYSKTVRLKPGANLVPVWIERDKSAGFYDYTVTVKPNRGDREVANNETTGIIRVMGAPGVLIVDGSERGRQGQNLRAALAAAGIRAELVDGESFPTSMLELNSYDCVILSDTPAQLLSVPQMESTRAWVNAGGGLVWVGGVNSFGPGRYSGTPIEEISPVSCDTKRDINRASLALVIAIDQSGSMGMPVTGNLTKMDLANNGAAEALKLLDGNDEAGVVMVDTRAKWIVNPPLRTMAQPAKRELIRDVLSNKPGGGGIYCRTALQAALDALEGVQAMSRHIVMFADSGDSEQQGGCREMVRDAHADGITVSTIGLGLSSPSNDGPFLEDIARIGGGRSYFTEDPRKLPRIFVRDVFIAASNAIIEPKEGITPAIVTLGRREDVDPICRGLGAPPTLRGQTLTTLKPRATLLMHGPEPDDPLLAKWHYGLGKVVAWTSDARGKWAGTWVGWPGFSPFWSQIVRWATRNANLDSPVTTWVSLRGQRGTIVVDAIDGDGEPINHLELRALVQSADLDAQVQSAELRLVAPGRYEGSFAAGRMGAYVVTIVDADDRALDATGAVMSYSPEFSKLAPDESFMTQVADTSGGRSLAKLTDLFAAPAGDVYTYKPIAMPLLAAAMLLFFCDIVVRRLVLPEAVIRWLTPARKMRTDADVAGYLRRRRSTRKKAAKAESAPVAVAIAKKAAERDLEPPNAATPPVEAQRGVGGDDSDAGGGMAERLRAAKRRAQQEMRDKSERDR